jgi:hypothetical protein
MQQNIVRFSLAIKTLENVLEYGAHLLRDFYNCWLSEWERIGWVAVEKDRSQDVTKEWN